MRVTVLLTMVLPWSAVSQDANWPAWRGPSLDGRAASSASPPVEWSETRNIRWKVPIPGIGTSTPSVWDGRIILTSAVPTGRTVPVERPAGAKKDPPNEVHELLVVAFDQATGDVVWKTTVGETVPHERHHETGSYASGSTVTDGTLILAFFGSRGLYALDMQGNKLWDFELPKMKTLAEFGEGSSPGLAGDMLVIPWDEEGQSFVAGVNIRTGKEVWRTPRETDSAWTTPLIQRDGDRWVAIVSGSKRTRAYDVRDGKELWNCGGMSSNPVSSPVSSNGTVFVGNAYKGTQLQAIRFASARGDLTSDPARLVWTHREAASYVPTPVINEGRLYYLRDTRGMLCCLDATTGQVVFRNKRLGLGVIHASPIVADGRIYVTSRDGMTVVVQADKEATTLAKNRLNAVFDASPVAVGSDLILRGRKKLYCVSADEPVR